MIRADATDVILAWHGIKSGKIAARKVLNNLSSDLF